MPLTVSVPVLDVTKPGVDEVVVFGAVHPAGTATVTTPLVVVAPAGGA